MLTNGLGRQGAERVCVPVQQYVHAGPGDQVVQPDTAPGRAHELVGQPSPARGPPLPPWCSLH